MSYNPDKNKQAQKVAFSRKRSKPKHPQLLFNKMPVAYSFSQNHLGITNPYKSYQVIKDRKEV